MNRGLIALALFLAATLLACNKNENKDGCTDPVASNYDPEAVYDDGTCKYNKGTLLVEGEITDTTIWYRDYYYVLRGNVYVRNGAQLRIDTGVVVFGEKSSHGTLIVQQGAQIVAEGAPETPVIFTSDQEPGMRSPGDWGGIIICGNAPTNYPGGGGTVNNISGTDFGGITPEESSGFLRNIRIEYAGYIAGSDQELGGLTFAGVGKQTVCDFVQVSYSGDDSFLWLGGLNNCRHLISYRPLDDDFDCNYAYHGVVQFVVGLRGPNANVYEGANGFESDNDNGTSNMPPFTNPSFTNVTLIGPKTELSTVSSSGYNTGLLLRNNTQQRLYNSVIIGYPIGLQLSGTITENNATNNMIQIRNSVLAGCPTDFVVDQSSSFDLATWFNTSTFSNTVFNLNSDVLLGSPFNLEDPEFLPQSGSPLLSGADFSYPNLQDPLIEAVDYKGAFGNDNWAGFANWTPQLTEY